MGFWSLGKFVEELSFAWKVHKVVSRDCFARFREERRGEEKRDIAQG